MFLFNSVFIFIIFDWLVGRLGKIGFLSFIDLNSWLLFRWIVLVGEKGVKLSNL